MNEPDHRDLHKIAASIDIGKLERESNRWLYLGLALGICFQVLLSIVFVMETAVIEKQSHIPIKLLIRESRAKNPFERRKTKPAKKRRSVYNRIPSTTPIDIPVIDRPLLNVPDNTGTGENFADHADIIPDYHEEKDEHIVDFPGFSGNLKTMRKLSGTLGEWNELLTLGMADSLMEGNALVIIDPGNRENLKGVAHMPVYVRDFMPGAYGLSHVAGGIAEIFHFFTGVGIEMDTGVTLTSPDLIDYPFIYITSSSDNAIVPSDGALRAFSDYLRSGGFAIMDNGTPWWEYSPVEASFVNALVEALGEDCRFGTIDDEHLIFHSFFDLPERLPVGYELTPPPIRQKRQDGLKAEEYSIQDWGELLHKPLLHDIRMQMSKEPHRLWGVWIGDRLAAVYIDKGYGYIWRYGALRSNHFTPVAVKNGLITMNEQMRLCVNLIAYALLRDDSDAVSRFIDSAPSPQRTARMLMEEKFATY